MKQISVLAFMLLGLLSCRTEGGGPTVALPQLESLSEPEFSEVLLHTEVFSKDAFDALLATGAVKAADLVEFSAFLADALEANEGSMSAGPHPITALIKANGPKGKAVLTAVVLIEDFLRLRWDLGPSGGLLSERTVLLLQTIAESARQAGLAATTTTL
jgi:hypothetical protein